MKHVMLDLETFGTKPGSVLRSVGAVFFDFQGNLGPEFYRNIDKDSCMAAGLSVDLNTEKWWSQQSQEAQDSLLVDPRPLADVVTALHAWFRAEGGVTVWAQGANFDPAMWEAAALAVNKPVPWRFYNVRDTRTVYDVGNVSQQAMPAREGTYHNALDDAKHQVRCVAKSIAQARNGGIAA